MNSEIKKPRLGILKRDEKTEEKSPAAGVKTKKVKFPCVNRTNLMLPRHPIGLPLP